MGWPGGMKNRSQLQNGELCSPMPTGMSQQTGHYMQNELVSQKFVNLELT